MTTRFDLDHVDPLPPIGERAARTQAPPAAPTPAPAAAAEPAAANCSHAWPCLWYARRPIA